MSLFFKNLLLPHDKCQNYFVSLRFVNLFRMFETIKTLIESTTGAPLKGNRTSLKLFCGLVHKHSYKSQKEVAAFLGVSKNLISYYITQHTNNLKILEYRVQFNELEKALIEGVGG